MKSLTKLWHEFAIEYGELCGASVDLDLKTVEVRVRNEGLSFFTISLPQFARDFENCLDAGCVSRADGRFTGFSWMTGRRNGLPVFLGEFLGLIFDPDSGNIREVVDQRMLDAIRAVRQLTLLYSKVEAETTKRRQAKALSDFLVVEHDVQKHADALSPVLRDRFGAMAYLLWGRVLEEVNTTLFRERNSDPLKRDYRSKFVPRHGPGATADRLAGNRKFEPVEWPRRLERVFPMVEYLIPNYRHFEWLERVTIVEPDEERPVKVTLVPKTMKTPRIIAIEPTAMQYVQQGLKNLLVPAIQADEAMGSVVGFTDQDVNRRMACEGSLTRTLATLDLSEASDRVSIQHVQALLGRYPVLWEAIQACRSVRADVPGHGVITLSKFASMGSALTFPVEAMVFTTVVFLGIEDALGVALTRSEVKLLRGSVRVYGDDIIVPTDFAPSVIRALETFGFKVNGNKSFWTGRFRESCGREYYAGHDVSVVKVRQLTFKGKQASLPLSRSNAQGVQSLVETRNRCYAVAGLWRVTAYLDGLLGSVLSGHFPNVEVDSKELDDPTSRSSLLGRFSFLGYQAEKWDRKLHGPLVRGWVVTPQHQQISVDDIGALMKVLSRQGEEPFEDAKHLERSGRPVAVRIKLRWARPF